MEESYLYVIGPSLEGPVKLGFSQHPDQRLKKLQTGHAQPLHVFHSEPIAADRVKAYERLLHRDDAHHRLRGEWYNLSVTEAIGYVRLVSIDYDLVDDLPSVLNRSPASY